MKYIPTHNTDFKLRAITWAAKKQNMSYGEYVQSHSEIDIENAYHSYELYLNARKAAREKIAQ